MKYILNTKYLFLALIVTIFTVACKKITSPEPLGDSGKTFVKIIGGGTPATYGKQSIDFVATPSTISINIQRLVANQTDLSKKMIVTITDDTAAVSFFNRDTVSTNPNASNPDLLELTKFPQTWYTVGSNATKTGGEGGTYTMVFNPNEFAKDLQIVIPNATLLDPSATYALAFKIKTVDADGVVADAKSYILGIGAKNSYDGVYDNIFTNYHPASNPGYLGGTVEVQLITSGANKVKIYFPDAGGFANPAYLNGTLSAFGAQEPEYTINTTTNEVTVQNSFSGATTFYNMNSSFSSRYDLPNRTIYAKFGYNNPGGIFNPAATREWTQKLVYKRAR